MIAVPIDTVQLQINKHKTEIDAFIQKAKTKLQSLEIKESGKMNRWQITYIKYIIDHIPEIVPATPDKLKIIQGIIGKVPKPIIKKNKRGGKHRKRVPKKSFSDKIIDCMGYKELRSDFYPTFFAGIGIKACVYCNSQLTVAINSLDYSYGKINNEVKAKFQLDHNLSKSENPAFSISLYNLYPVCGSCNIAKGVTPVNFELYSTDPIKYSTTNYSFKLNSHSLVSYLLHKKIDLLKIEFIDPQKPNKNIRVLGSFQDTFDIEGIYETQKDLVEELIILSRVYNKPYKITLLKSFSKLFSGYSISNRVLIGNYTEPQEIHKRPMAKFTQDISRQLKLI